uniref:Uncharacterized protein n=1 Tax=Anguilla anguilla TaxID=7936 RepID=A0A0E9TBN0_ANGAN
MTRCGNVLSFLNDDGKIPLRNAGTFVAAVTTSSVANALLFRECCCL